MTPAARQRQVSVAAVADSDSYLKWSAATLDALPASWLTEQWVLRSPILPSAAQRRAATGRRLSVAGVEQLVRAWRRDPPDVLLLACTGPVVAHLLARLADLLARPDRPVVVTGLPGISVPASARAVAFRRGSDLLVVHSRTEQQAFGALVAQASPTTEVGLARLPFLTGTPVAGGLDVVFAAQAKFPAHAEDRRAVLRALAGLPAPYRAVVKLRGTAGEGQTHHEPLPYPRLWADLVRRGEVGADQVRFDTGAMRTALDRARGLVTVSSTAALEAVDAGVPILVLDEFGVSDELVNAVFAGSGCLGSLADLAAARFRPADPEWCERNYFHPPSAEDWLSRIEHLVSRRGTLPPVPVRAPGRRARVRTAARLHAPAVSSVVGRVTRLRSRR